MTADLQVKCVKCGKEFWWTAREQDFYHARGLVQPKRCRRCRSSSRNGGGATQVTPTPIPEAGELDSISVRAIPVPAPLAVFGDHDSLFSDIKDELDLARAPIIRRRRNLWEWVRRVDIIAQQRDKKSLATQNAVHLMSERIKVLESAGRLTAVAGQTQLESSKTIVAQLEIDNQGMVLLNSLQEHRTLGPMRRETQILEEQVKQRSLKETLRESDRDEDERQANRVRRMRNAEVRARQTKLDDFLKEVQDICDSRKPIAEKALRIREVQSAFEMDEASLPAEARTIFQKAEKAGDD
jgi:hypothetical protein